MILVVLWKEVEMYMKQFDQMEVEVHEWIYSNQKCHHNELDLRIFEI